MSVGSWFLKKMKWRIRTSSGSGSSATGCSGVSTSTSASGCSASSWTVDMKEEKKAAMELEKRNFVSGKVTT